VTDFVDLSSGVFHGDAFRHLLTRETSRATRYQDFFSICLARPDGEGQPAEIIQEIELSVSRKIAQFLRSTDVVARLQDGIAIILLHTAGPDAVRVAERIRAHIENVAFPSSVGASPRQVTISVGEVSFPRDGYNDAVLLSRAQAHLNEASRRGGNRVVYASEDTD
jgi:predicted signal transduction protein with EAL and GGDEF domain